MGAIWAVMVNPSFLVAQVPETANPKALNINYMKIHGSLQD